MQNCEWCGMIHVHGGMCPTIKAMEYYENGALKRVEFKQPQTTSAFGPALSVPNDPFKPFVCTSVGGIETPWTAKL